MICSPKDMDYVCVGLLESNLYIFIEKKYINIYFYLSF